MTSETPKKGSHDAGRHQKWKPPDIKTPSIEDRVSDEAIRSGVKRKLGEAFSNMRDRKNSTSDSGNTPKTRKLNRSDEVKVKQFNVSMMGKYGVYSRERHGLSEILLTEQDAHDVKVAELRCFSLENTLAQCKYCLSRTPGKRQEDYMFLLLFDSRRGKMLREFEKIVRYLTDEYFSPVNPSGRKSSASQQIGQVPNSNLSPVVEDSDGISAEDLALLQSMRKKHSSVLDKEGEKKHKLRSCPNNVEVLSSLKETFSLVLEMIRKEEEASLVKYEDVLNSLYGSCLFNIPDVINQGEGGTESSQQSAAADDCSYLFQMIKREKDKELMEFASNIVAEVHLVEYMTTCEGSYLYLRFLILITLGYEESISKMICDMSDPVKFKGLPFLVRLLTRGILNGAFNFDNSQGKIKDFVTACTRYYCTGMVPEEHCREFYGASEAEFTEFPFDCCDQATPTVVAK